MNTPYQLDAVPRAAPFVRMDELFISVGYSHGTPWQYFNPIQARGRAETHPPANSKEHIIQEEERRCPGTKFRPVDRVIRLREEPRNKNVADTLSCRTPHHQFAASCLFDQDKAEEGEHQVGNSIARGQKTGQTVG
jgi:hypothetical protein